MRMIQQFTRGNRKALPLPETGIYDNNGHLFHHASIRSMVPAHIQRLEEHGIYLKRRCITEEDNEKIRSNWRKFALEFNLEDRDLLSFIGFRMMTRKNSPEVLQRKEFIETSFFWPRMCDGFPNSSAKAIRNQLAVLYDPANDIEGANVPMTQEEEQLAIRMYRSGRTFYEISEFLKKAYLKTSQKMYSLLIHKEFPSSARRKLWNFISDSSQVKIADLSALSEMKIDWTTVSRVLFYNQKSLQEQWKIIATELTKLIVNGTPWDDAFEKVLPKCEDISPSDFADFVDLFIEEKKYDDTLHCTKQDKIHLTKQMMKRGISGFRSGRFSEYNFCRYRLGRMFWKIRHGLIEPAHLCLSIRTQMTLISRCVRAFADSSYHAPRIQLRRHLVVSELIRLMFENDREWKPSRKLKKYIDHNL